MKITRALTLGAIAFSSIILTGCLHSLLDVDNKDDKILYLYTAGTTAGSINGGSRAGVDAFCATNKPMELTCTGGVHAFISIDGSDLAYNLDTKYSNLPTDAAIYNPDKSKKIADNWSDLTDGSIGMPLQNALGLSTDTWTGGSTGSATCSQWTDNSAGNGTPGNRTAADFTWFDYTPTPCSSPFNVLCICWDD